MKELNMAQRKIMINLPGSPEMLREIIPFLLQRGLISKKKANALEPENPVEKPKKKSRWELAAERLDSEGFLDGKGDQAKELLRDFRENFSI